MTELKVQISPVPPVPIATVLEEVVTTGELVFPDGSNYRGGFNKQGRFQGEGTILFADGKTTVKAIWHEGKVHPDGHISYEWITGEKLVASNSVQITKIMKAENNDTTTIVNQTPGGVVSFKDRKGGVYEGTMLSGVHSLSLQDSLSGKLVKATSSLSPRESKSPKSLRIVEVKGSTIKPAFSGSGLPGGLVKMVVGGEPFSTSFRTIFKREPDSKLLQWLVEAHNNSPNSSFKRDAEGRYAIDRSAKLFRVIMSYIVDGENTLPTNQAQLKELLVEAEYFELHNLVGFLKAHLDFQPVASPMDSVDADLLGFHKWNGSHKDADGTSYTGQFLGLLYDGQGTLIYKSKKNPTVEKRYKGNFKLGKKDGQGELKDSKGTYAGVFVAGKRHGKGRFTTTDKKVVFEGEFYKGVIKGKGKIIWEDKSSFEGDFVDGLPDGKGVWTFANGDRYEGEVNKGKMHGEGVYYYSNGDIYCGRFLEDSITGRGELLRKCGEVTVGVQKSVSIPVLSISTDNRSPSDVEAIRGDFQQGVFQGYGHVWFKNGSVLTCQTFVKGKPVGKATLTTRIRQQYSRFYDSDGVTYKSNYEDPKENIRNSLRTPLSKSEESLLGVGGSPTMMTMSGKLRSEPPRVIALTPRK
eukprot:TRINITY_DN5152_c0_g1_i2.p1 TRINITY_DN5152_c0_g1~~TRINITY_DN5152_c0_g1_i2.p1  ORF type:complete len:636 (+),score=84.47 TRINITY_DN5152_c0_g1_i2:330-2237(+)